MAVGWVEDGLVKPPIVMRSVVSAFTAVPIVTVSTCPLAEQVMETPANISWQGEVMAPCVIETSPGSVI